MQTTQKSTSPFQATVKVVAVYALMLMSLAYMGFVSDKVTSLEAELAGTVAQLEAMRGGLTFKGSVMRDLAYTVEVANDNGISPWLADAIITHADDNDIPHAVAFGLVREESGFRQYAVSRVGASGLAQLMPATARWLDPTVEDIFDPDTNLSLGFRYLRMMHDAHGDWEPALWAYNMGPNALSRRGGVPYQESSIYASRVLR